MSDTDVQIETWNEWENNIEELNKLKKEMAGRVLEKMKENDNDFALLVWKDLVVDYLVDENDDKVSDFFLGIGLNVFSGCSEQLKDLREKINKTKSKQELDELEKTIIEDLENSASNEWKDLNQNSSKEAVTVTSTWVATTAVVGSSKKSKKLSNENLWTSNESAPVWEAVEVPLKDRMDWLFPDWTPNSKEEMKKYITKIEIPIITHQWKEKKLNLQIHKKLANEYKAIFQEMYDKKIPINPSSTWWFNWRKMRHWNKMSHHSYGSAVDVNWDVNGWVYGKTDKDSPYFNDNETVAIWKKHGFYWWWDWSKKSYDPMHFSYMNC